MALLGLGYLFCLAGVHQLTSGVKGRMTYVLMTMGVVAAWVCYLALHEHRIFTAIFTLQVCCSRGRAHVRAPVHISTERFTQRLSPTHPLGQP